MDRGAAGGSTSSSEAARHRTALVDALAAKELLPPGAIRDAFVSVPRHAFVPGLPYEEVYADRSVELKRERHGLTSSSSPPSVMALMLAQLEPSAGHRVLEIGTGSGYNAALLSHVVGRSGRVTTIDLDRDLTDTARSRLRQWGAKNVEVVCGDGGEGHAPGQPYDRIIVTASADDISPAWWAQLAEDGRIVVPLVLRHTQVSIAFERRHGILASTSAACCSFIPMRGRRAVSSRRVPLGIPGLWLETSADAPHDQARLTHALGEPSCDYPTGVVLSVADYVFGLRLWLELEEPGFAGLLGDTGGLGAMLVPPLVRLAGTVSTGVLQGAEPGVAALVLPPSAAFELDDVNELGTTNAGFELHVRELGHAPELVRHLIGRVRAWDEAGRPFRGVSRELHVHAHPKPVAAALAGRLVIERPTSTFTVDWSPDHGVSSSTKRRVSSRRSVSGSSC